MRNNVLYSEFFKSLKEDLIIKIQAISKTKGYFSDFFILRLIALLWPIGYIFWITCLILFIPWSQKISKFKEEALLNTKEIVLISTVLLFLILSGSKIFLKRIFLPELKTALMMRNFIGSLLVILAISYITYIKIKEKDLDYIRKSKYYRESEIISEVENEITRYDMNAVVYPYLNFKTLKRLVDPYRLEIFPLSMPSNSYILYCYDGEEWIYYKSDKFGFRNTDNSIWENNRKHKILIAGDSLSHVNCSSESVADIVREKLRSIEIEVKNFDVIDLTGRSENIIVTFMKIKEFLLENTSFVFLLLTRKSFNDILQYWDKEIVQKYIKDLGKKQYRNEKSKLDSIVIDRLSEIREKNIFDSVFNIYELVYSPWALSELIEKIKRKNESTKLSETEIEISKFILKAIDSFVENSGSKTFFMFIEKENELEEIRIKIDSEHAYSIDTKKLQSSSQTYNYIAEKIKEIIKNQSAID
ncbi:MAG: hypothetical protein NZ927_01405 [Candidatus Calescibacterium sp.]|nr:hypothetical protein [Candidatus Calescibacterium sp.]MDW8087182.1 hypothetical protein [Candidatus Calescibacterium sp.]